MSACKNCQSKRIDNMNDEKTYCVDCGAIQEDFNEEVFTCTKCKSKKLIAFRGQCDDHFVAEFEGMKNDEYNGYVPQGLNISKITDMIEIEFCANCGQMKGEFPIPQENIDKYWPQKEE